VKHEGENQMDRPLIISSCSYKHVVISVHISEPRHNVYMPNQPS